MSLDDNARFTDGNGALVGPSDRVQYRFGGSGVVQVIFQDGSAYVAFDGEPGDRLVNWKHLAKEPGQ